MGAEYRATKLPHLQQCEGYEQVTGGGGPSHRLGGDLREIQKCSFKGVVHDSVKILLKSPIEYLFLRFQCPARAFS
jgi:hypothetical protein